MPKHERFEVWYDGTYFIYPILDLGGEIFFRVTHRFFALKYYIGRHVLEKSSLPSRVDVGRIVENQLEMLHGEKSNDEHESCEISRESCTDRMTGTRGLKRRPMSMPKKVHSKGKTSEDYKIRVYYENI